MNIDIAGPMVSAQRAADDTYTPVVDGTKLNLECGNVQVTLANLNRLLTVEPDKIRREVVSIYSVRGNILVVFDTGESYLATGFALGSDQPESSELALFAVKHGLAEKKLEARRRCRELDEEHTGPVFPLPRMRGDEDSAIISTGDTQTLPIRRD